MTNKADLGPDAPVVTRGRILPVVGRDVFAQLATQKKAREAAVHGSWILLKRIAGMRRIREVAVNELLATNEVTVSGYADDPNRLVIAAVCRWLKALTFFEFGTFLGRTSLSVARTCPDIEVFTLDLPSEDAAVGVELELTDPHLFEQWQRGRAFEGEPEHRRIHMLHGDSASFDYQPYHQKIDVVYIDGSHSYSYVKNDTEAALTLLTERGVIFWDDYPLYPGVFAYLQELVRDLPGELIHIDSTRLVVYSRTPLL